MPALLQKLTLPHTITYCTCNFPRSVDPTVHYRMQKGPPLCNILSHVTQATCLLQTANEPRITFQIQRNYISDQCPIDAIKCLSSSSSFSGEFHNTYLKQCAKFPLVHIDSGTNTAYRRAVARACYCKYVRQKAT